MPMCEYERIREGNIRERRQLFLELGLEQARKEAKGVLEKAEKALKRTTRPPAITLPKDETLEVPPSPKPLRRSSRLPATKVSYADMDNSIDKEEREERATKRKRIGNITREEWEVGNQERASRSTEVDEEGHKISNDLADYVRVACQLCDETTPLTRLRSHTASAHKMKITDYKKRFGADPELLEVVFHRCGVCSNLVLFDNDAIAVHLKSGNHPRITHKDYNRTYMFDSRRGDHD